MQRRLASVAVATLLLSACAGGPAPTAAPAPAPAPGETELAELRGELRQGLNADLSWDRLFHAKRKDPDAVTGSAEVKVQAGPSFGSVDPGGELVMGVDLAANQTFSLSARCAPECEGFEVSVRAPDGRLLETTGPASRRTTVFTAGQPARYEVRASVSSCGGRETCLIGHHWVGDGTTVAYDADAEARQRLDEYLDTFAVFGWKNGFSLMPDAERRAGRLVSGGDAGEVFPIEPGARHWLILAGDPECEDLSLEVQGPTGETLAYGQPAGACMAILGVGVDEPSTLTARIHLAKCPRAECGWDLRLARSGPAPEAMPEAGIRRRLAAATAMSTRVASFFASVEPREEAWISSFAGNTPVNITRDLQAGHLYFAVGQCGQDCSSLEIQVVTPSGAVALDKEAGNGEDDRVMFVARETGPHLFSIAPRSCRREPCQIGMQLLHTPKPANISADSYLGQRLYR